MKKIEKSALAELLESATVITEQKWDSEGPMTAAYCYGYLLGVVKQAILELEK